MISTKKISSSSSGRSGFTLLEAMIAGTVISIGLLGFAVSLITAHSLRQTTQQTTVAMNAGRYALEEVEAVGDVDYIINELNGFTFTVAALEGPDRYKAFPDGSVPNFVPSSTLPDFYDPSGAAAGGASADPVLDTSYDLAGVGLRPARSMSRGYGLITVDTTDPDLIVVHVDIEFGTARGNRRVSFHSHMLRQP